LARAACPRGRIVEVYGPESSGKTTLALHVVAEAQRAGGVCAFIDAEHALDLGYARKLGSRPRISCSRSRTTASKRWRITDMLVRSEAVDVIVIDPSRRWCPRPSSKERWAIRTWACRPGS